MTEIHIPMLLRQYFEGSTINRLYANSSILDVLKDLSVHHSKLEQYFFCDDKISPYINIYLNGIDVRDLNKEKTIVKENDQIDILLSVAGG